MVKLLIGGAVPLLILLLSIPMILDRVPPNGAYGFRTPKTLSSPEIWYPANRAAGWFMLAAMVVAICFNLALWWAYPEWPHDSRTQAAATTGIRRVSGRWCR